VPRRRAAARGRLSRVRADHRELAAVFAGGCLGALARAALGEWLPYEPGTWPWATFAANLAGSALLAWIVVRGTPVSRRLVGTGFCGALTTFSALQLELLEMLDAGHALLAAAYVAASVAGGLVLVRLAGGAARG
jgi:CrcB protein